MTHEQPHYDLAVIHGRFQVLHNDHLKYLLAGKAVCRHMVVGITNPDPGLTQSDPSDPNRSRALNNPLTYFERYQLVRAALVESDVPEREFSIVPMPINFPDLFQYYLPLQAVFLLTIYDDWGRKKQRLFEGLGLSTHVLWEKPEKDKGLTGSEVRSRMARGESWESLVPKGVYVLLREWDIPGRLRALKGEKGGQASGY